MKFNAAYIDAYTNSTTANVMFADPDQPSVLSFSRPIEPGFEDSAYYFEINDQSYGSYMGLESVKLSHNSIEIRLEQGVAEKFDKKDFLNVRVEFEADDALYQSVQTTLKRIFQGYEDIFQIV